MTRVCRVRVGAALGANACDRRGDARGCGARGSLAAVVFFQKAAVAAGGRLTR